LFQKRHGKRLDASERARKREARAPHAASKLAQNVRGIRAKLLNEKRFKEKIAMTKAINKSEEREVEHGKGGPPPGGALPAYLLDREETTRAKVLSNTVKQKRKEKAGKWAVPLPKVKPVTDDEMFKIMRTGKRKQKAWKRMVTKVTFVGESFTRKPPKYERFIRPMGLRFKRAHVTHPELKTTFNLDIVGVKKNPSSTMYTQLGVITKGTIIGAAFCAPPSPALQHTLAALQRTRAACNARPLRVFLCPALTPSPFLHPRLPHMQR
jgi:ribosome biogenesis protein NSA2